MCALPDVILLKLKQSGEAPNSFARTLVILLQRPLAARRFSDFHPHLPRTGTTAPRPDRMALVQTSLRLHQSSEVLVVAPLPSHVLTSGGSAFFVASSTCLSSFFFPIASNLFLRVSECDIVPRGGTPCSSTHLCVMYCLLTTGSLAAPSGLVCRSAHNAIQGVFAVAVTLW